MIESSLLSKDEHLTPDINKFVVVWFLEGGLKTWKLPKIGFLNPGFYFFIKHKNEEINLGKIPDSFETAANFKIIPVKLRSVDLRKNIHR